ncbi:MAG: hypothetical protein SVR08_04775 [Spirochaetota bacterium]|nr:hypothetical protein [Spirochaetota bacterium]
MQSALFRIYEVFEDAFGRDKARACIEDLVSLVEKTQEGLAKKEDIKHNELILTKEIEEVRKETKEMETRLIKETKEMETRLVKETKEMVTRLVREINKSKIWFITSVGIILTILKALDYFLK